MIRRWLPALAGLLVTSPAWGQSPAAADLFERGRAIMAAGGDLAQACNLFRESDRLDPAPGSKANLGACEEKRGRLATAWAAYKDALDRLPPGDRRVALLRERVAALEPRLPRLLLQLAPGAPPGTQVSDQGELVRVFEVAIPVDPGPRTVVASAPGRRPKTFRTIVVEGRTTKLAIAPEPEVAPAPSSAGPWVVMGVGAAGLAAGAVMGALTVGAKATVNVKCIDGPPPTCQDQTGLDAASRVRTLGPATTIALAAGSAALLGGGIWLGLQKSRHTLRMGVTITNVSLEGSW